MLPVAFADELNLAYDNNGNLITGDGKYREYNSLNQLIKVYNGSSIADPLLEEFIHHPTEERILVKKIYNNDGSINETVYYIDENSVRVINATGTYDFSYIKHEGQLVAQQNPSGNNIYIHADHIGSTSVVTNGSRDIIENTSYTPFGEVVEGGTASRYGYEGKEHDSVVGDTDFHFRKYKAEWALFLQPDSLPNGTITEDIYNPQSLNRYAFERNNPFKYRDDDGHGIVLVVGIVYVAWKVWGLALTIAPLVEKAVEGDLKIKDIKDTIVHEAPKSLVPILGDYITYKKTENVIRNIISRFRKVEYSGIDMSDEERNRNIKTIRSGGFKQIRKGVYKKTTYSYKSGKKYKTTRVVYT